MTKVEVKDKVKYIGESNGYFTSDGMYPVVESNKWNGGIIVLDDGGTHHHLTGDYLLLNFAKIKNKERITALEETVQHMRAELDKAYEVEQDLLKRVSALEFVLAGNSKLSTNIKSVPQLNVSKTVKTANQLRAEMIKKAKEFIEKSKDVTGGLSGRKGYKHNLAGYADAEFVINVEKLTIVCLLKRQFGGQILGKGITKCNPSDVFNVWIGKAIALGRALGLDVSEFEQAVQPTVAVGQLIEVYSLGSEPTGRFLTVNGINSKGYPTHDDGTYTSHYKIINDTDAQY